MAGWIPEHKKTPERKMMDRAVQDARRRRDFKAASSIENEIRRYEDDRKRAADWEKIRRDEQVEGYIKGAAIVGGVYAASKAADALSKPNSAISAMIGMCFWIAVAMTAWTFITDPSAFFNPESTTAEIVEPVEQPTLSDYELQIRNAEAQRNFAEPVEEPVETCVTPEIIGDQVYLHRYEC